MLASLVSPKTPPNTNIRIQKCSPHLAPLQREQKPPTPPHHPTKKKPPKTPFPESYLLTVPLHLRIIRLVIQLVEPNSLGVPTEHMDCRGQSDNADRRGFGSGFES